VERAACSIHVPGEDAPTQIQIRISLKYHAPQMVRPDASQARLRYPMPSLTVMWTFHPCKM
jgi:hypothetical protein